MASLFNRFANVFEGTYTLRVISSFFEIILNLAPYLAVSLCIGASVNFVFKRINLRCNPKYEWAAIILAAAIGLISPLPTFIALPIGLSLVSGGIPVSAVIAFAVASPLLNPSIFYLTYTQLGAGMAWARAIASFTLAVAAGLIYHAGSRFFTSPHQAQESNSWICALTPRPFCIELYRNFLYIIKYFSIAALISAAVKAFIPPETITALMGNNIRLSLLTAVALGVPLYNCGGAAIPIIRTLQELGMNSGAALAFFIAGPATKLETLYVYQRLLGLRTAIFYLVLTLTGAYLAGWVYYSVGG
jgi:uncharacterized membrane protein YraQ (UPF0718 family)